MLENTNLIVCVCLGGGVLNLDIGYSSATKCSLTLYKIFVFSSVSSLLKILLHDLFPSCQLSQWYISSLLLVLSLPPAPTLSTPLVCSFSSLLSPPFHNAHIICWLISAASQCFFFSSDWPLSVAHWFKFCTLFKNHLLELMNKNYLLELMEEC